MNHIKTGVPGMTAAVRLCLAAVALGAAGAGSAVAADTTRVIVAFKPGTAAKIKALVSAAHGAVKLEITGMDAMAIEVPAAALRALARNPNIDYLEEDVKRYPFALTSDSKKPYLSGQRVPYGIGMVQADQLGDGYAANRKLCIIDSGYDRAHEDLGANPADGRYDRGTGWWYTGGIL